MRSPIVVRRLLGFIGLAAYTLIFGEIFVRVADPQPLMPRYVTETPWGVRGNIPDAHYRQVTPEVTAEFRINGQGMRADHDFSFSKAAGTCRIALFGDSYFMGYEANLKDTFATRLEERLRTDHFNAEVLNFAVSGFGTAEMIRTYDSYGRRFAPDVVVFQWNSSDLSDNVRADLFELKGGSLKSTGKSYLPSIKIQDALMKSSIYRFVADNSQLYSFVRERTSGLVQRLLLVIEKPHFKTPGPVPMARVAQSESDRQPPSYSMLLSAALLRYAQQMAIKDGRDFLIVDIPDRISRTSFKSWVSEILTLEPNLNVVSPLAVFKHLASPNTKLYYERGHFHLTPLAIDALVGIVAPRLEQSPGLRGCEANR